MEERRRTYLLVALTLAVVCAALPGPLSCTQKGNWEQTEAITVGGLKDLTSGPAVVAASQGFFADNGLDVSFIRFETGAQASQALNDGGVDIAYMAEYVMVRNGLARLPVRVIASESKYEGVLLAARKSRGIVAVSALKGERVGVAMQTVNLFYLGRLLERNGLGLGDVTTVDGTQSQLVELFNRGELNAVVFSRIWVNQLEPQSDLLVLPAQGNQAGHRLAVARTDWIGQHADAVRRYLRAIDMAEALIISEPAVARPIIEEMLNLDPGYLETEWPVTQFGLSLDLSLIAEMNDEAAWMIGNGLTTETAIPDFAAYFYLDGLKAVKPEAVNIIR